ncbi:universal stress protein [Flagellimonas nanhaiensis]|uniref:Universal stress protein n=1 Tax=Flagellimonas nanhaiensis TaxID=2292706 RepID=A0A371JUU0_9FLAO|nr:universal stress protein [Allomuricauda nanhaiensis]RDY61575.1 universal stress protein [Allomuricauda nanhaiensis]
MNTKKNKYQILVLSDLSPDSNISLLNAVELARTINASVEVLHVKAPLDVVKGDNQLSAIRTIHKDNRSTESRLRSQIEDVVAKANIAVAHKIAYGNVKSTIKNYLSEKQPDIVVLGKPQTVLGKLLDKGVTNFVLNECNVNVLISGDEIKQGGFKDLSLGFYGRSISDMNQSELLDDLNKQTTKPLRMFSVNDGQNASEENSTEGERRNIVSYVFSEGKNALEGIVSYVKKTNTELFCISSESAKGIGLMPNTTKQMVRRLNIPILVMR